MAQQTLPPAVASLIFFNLDNHFPSLAFFIPFSPHNFHLLTTILLLRALILSRREVLCCEERAGGNEDKSNVYLEPSFQQTTEIPQIEPLALWHV